MNSSVAGKTSSSKRDSNIELLRMVMIFLIVCYHAVLYSGYGDPNGYPAGWASSHFFSCFLGCFGKVGVDVFLLITGYFMCRQEVRYAKFGKLIAPVLFWNIVIAAVFITCGRMTMTGRTMFSTLFPFVYIGNGFVAAYLAFFFLIPFLNVLVAHLTQRQFKMLLMVLLIVFTVLPSVPVIFVPIGNYVGWFCIVYLVGAYLRLFPPVWTVSRGKTSVVLATCLFLDALSIAAMMCFKRPAWNFFLVDANKILAVVTAVAFFACFRSINIGVRPVINWCASTTWGVLLIHDNIPQIRDFFWKDVFGSGLSKNAAWLLL